MRYFIFKYICLKKECFFVLSKESIRLTKSIFLILGCVRVQNGWLDCKLWGNLSLVNLGPSDGVHLRYRSDSEPTIRWAEPKHSQSNKKTSTREVFLLAGLAGFEPTNDGIKNRCLTTWRQPNFSLVIVFIYHFVIKCKRFFAFFVKNIINRDILVFL